MVNWWTLLHKWNNRYLTLNGDILALLSRMEFEWQIYPSCNNRSFKTNSSAQNLDLASMVRDKSCFLNLISAYSNQLKTIKNKPYQEKHQHKTTREDNLEIRYKMTNFKMLKSCGILKRIAQLHSLQTGVRMIFSSLLIS